MLRLDGRRQQLDRDRDDGQPVIDLTGDDNNAMTMETPPEELIYNPLNPDDDFEFEYVWRMVPITSNGESVDRACARLQEIDGFEYASTLPGIAPPACSAELPARDRGAVHLFRMKQSDWEVVKRAKSAAGPSE